MPPTPSRRARRALLLVAVGLAAPLFVEGALRLARPDASYLRYDRITRWVLRPDWRGPGPTLPHASRTYEVRTNRLGFRGPALRVDRDPGTGRFVALGDSVTFGFGVGEDEAFPALVAAALAAHDGSRRVEGINAGVPGFTSLQGLRHLEARVLPLRPDLVTVLFGWNDGWRSPVEDAAWIDRLGGLRAVLEPSRVFSLARRGAGFLRRNLVGEPPATLGPRRERVPIEAFETNLRAIAARARASGAQVVLLTPPAAFGPDRPPASFFEESWSIPREDLEPTRARYAEAVRRVAGSDAVSLADAARRVPSDPALFLEDGYHPNAEGHRRIARVVVEAILAGGGLASSPPR